MARIRTLKPEFWGDEKLAPMDPLTRLVFLGLISMADDAGRLLDSVKLIDGMLFAMTDDSSREALANLSRTGRIQRGATSSGQGIIQITGWRHQKVDHPNLKAALPPIVKGVTEDSRTAREPLANETGVPRDSTSTNEQLKEYVPSSDGTRPAAVVGLPAAANVGRDGRPYPPAFEATWLIYPGRPNNPKKAAYKAWRTRVVQGDAAPELLHAGTERYRGYCERRGWIGTETVKLGATFFGPGEHWKERFEELARPAMTSGRTAVMNSAELSEYKRAELESINAHRLARGEAPLVNA